MVPFSSRVTWADLVCLPSRGEYARGLSAFLAGLLLLDRFAVIFGRRTEGSLWLLDLRILPPVLATACEVILAVALLAVAARRCVSPKAIRLLSPVLFAGAGVAFLNGLNVLFLGMDRVTLPALPPVSLLLAGGLMWIATSLRTTSQKQAGSALRACVVAACVAAVFPVAEVMIFGNTNYARPAETAVVFGARTYANGRLSTALDDRVKTACALYQSGKVRRLLMSGGPGDGAIHETEAMRRRAIELGVPGDAIMLDQGGVNTRATVRNSLQELGRSSRLIVVSEFYHLPRIKLAYAQAGVDVVTVPAKAGHWLRRLPLRSVLREIPAFWSYYFGGLVSH